MVNKNSRKRWQKKEDRQERAQSLTWSITLTHVIFRPGLVFFILLWLSSLLVFQQNGLFFSSLILSFLSFIIFYFLKHLRREDGKSRQFLFCFYLLAVLCLFFRYGQIEKNINFANQTAGETKILTGTVRSVHNSDVQGKKWCSVDFMTDEGALIKLLGPSEELQYGNKLRVLVDCSWPETQKNPGGFSQEQFLHSQGIFLQAKVSNKHIEILAQAKKYHPFVFFTKIRSQIIESVTEIFPQEQSGLLLALLIGENKLLPPATNIALRRAGFSHLTSVSGSHVAFFILPLSLLLNKFSLERKKLCYLYIFFLLMYGSLTGWKTGALRAIIMQIVLIYLTTANKLYDRTNVLGFTAGFMLLMNPAIHKQEGFWLSVCATAILGLIASPAAVKTNELLADSSYKNMSKSVIRSLWAAISLQLLLLPITVKISGEIFWLSWLFNLPAMLLASIICGTGIPLLLVLQLLILLSSAFSLIDRSVLPFFQQMTSIILLPPITIFRKLAFYGATNKLRTSISYFSSLLLIGLYLLLLYIWFCLIKPRHFFYKRLLATSGSSLLIIGIVLSIIKYQTAPIWSFYFFDVGQGDSILLHNVKDNLSILIDGGPSGCGYYDLVPALTNLGISSVDLVILTHGHADHAQGLQEIAELGFIKALLVPRTPMPIDYYAKEYGQPEMRNEAIATAIKNDMTLEVFESVGKAASTVQFLEKHDTISLPTDAKLEILHPHKDLQLNKAIDDLNHTCLIICFEWEKYRFYLLADMTADVEKELSSEWLEADLIKVAHHGSKFATGDDFLEKVQPHHAIISSGVNSYGHPSSEVIARLNDHDCQIWRTDQGGCVVLRLKKNSSKIDYYKGR